MRHLAPDPRGAACVTTDDGRSKPNAFSSFKLALFGACLLTKALRKANRGARPRLYSDRRKRLRFGCICDA